MSAIEGLYSDKRAMQMSEHGEPQADPHIILEPDATGYGYFV